MIELFCGAGLFSHAFARNGFTSVLSADLDSDAISSFNQNLDCNSGIVHDVLNIVSVKAELLVAGPPCQGFSTLGKRDSKDSRNRLSLVLPEWAEACDVKVVVIENVPQFLNSEYSSQLCSVFKTMGYEVVQWSLDAHKYGVPQKRKRSFSIFSKIGLPAQPSESEFENTVLGTFKGLREKSKDAMHQFVLPTELALERIKNIPKNGGKFDLMKNRPDLCPSSWYKLGNQACDVWGRMDATKPANTIRCAFQNPSKGRYIHPNKNRVITLREGARLQGVPDSWQFIGTRTSIARQIGNGVPIQLGNSVAKEIACLF